MRDGLVVEGAGAIGLALESCENCLQLRHLRKEGSDLVCNTRALRSGRAILDGFPCCGADCAIAGRVGRAGGDNARARLVALDGLLGHETEIASDLAVRVVARSREEALESGDVLASHAEREPASDDGTGTIVGNGRVCGLCGGCR